MVDRTAPDVDMIILPELWHVGAFDVEAARAHAQPIDGPLVTSLGALAAEHRIWLHGGSFCELGDDGRHYNTSVLFAPDGALVVSYRKIHLFFEEKLWFSPGDRKPAVYDIGACRVGVMICFDWFFPEMTRILALQGADVICHSANLVLPYCQDVMITRCLENRVFAVTCNRTGSEQRGGKTLAYTGRSQIVDPRGNVLFRAGRETEEIRVADVDVKAARDKQLNEHNNLFADRRPRFYGALVGEPEGG